MRKQNAIVISNTAEIVPAMGLTSMVDAWIEHLELNVSAGQISQDTAATYRRGATKFIAWMQDRNPSQDAILEWMKELKANGNKPAAINAWLGGVRSLFRWAATSAHIPFSPAQGIKSAKRSGTKKRHIRESLTDDEAVRLLKQPDKTTSEGLRDYAMLAVHLYTAGRGIELNRADVKDLQTNSGRLVLMVQGKGQDEKDEPLVLNAEASEAVRDWLAVHPRKDGALFVSLSDRSRGERLSRSGTREILKRYFKKAGIVGNKTVHSLRHTAITKAIRSGVPITRVSKQFARHASIDTTMIYVHEADRMSDPVEDHIFYGGD